MKRLEAFRAIICQIVLGIVVLHLCSVMINTLMDVRIAEIFVVNGLFDEAIVELLGSARSSHPGDTITEQIVGALFDKCLEIIVAGELAVFACAAFLVLTCAYPSCLRNVRGQNERGEVRGSTIERSGVLQNPLAVLYKLAYSIVFSMPVVVLFIAAVAVVNSFQVGSLVGEAPSVIVLMPLLPILMVGNLMGLFALVRGGFITHSATPISTSDIKVAE